jgi:hypothetical protein
LIFLSGPAGSYVTPTQFPTASVTPVAPVSPSITLPTPSTIIVPPSLSEIYLPTEFLPIPPATPPPPPKVIPPTPKPAFPYLTYLMILLIIGLPLHLLMTQFGTNTSFRYTFRFLLVLLFPFTSSKKSRTHPFTTVVFYDPKITYQPWQIVISDINGKYSIKENPPKDFFIKCFSFKRKFNPVIIPSAIHPLICLYSLPESREKLVERLQISSFHTRSFPLILAILTSSITLFFIPNYFILAYLYLSLQAAYSEYYYPRFQK